MKRYTIRQQWFLVIWSWLIFYGLIGLMLPVLAQSSTNSLPPAPTDLSIFPTSKDSIWLALITPITFTITWLVGKIPPLPKEILPWLTPVIGILIGTGIRYATNAHWSWWSEAGAGAIAVTLYEAVKGLTDAGPKSMLTPTPTVKKV